MFGAVGKIAKPMCVCMYVCVCTVGVHACRRSALPEYTVELAQAHPNQLCAYSTCSLHIASSLGSLILQCRWEKREAWYLMLCTWLLGSRVISEHNIIWMVTSKYLTKCAYLAKKQRLLSIDQQLGFFFTCSHYYWRTYRPPILIDTNVTSYMYVRGHQSFNANRCQALSHFSACYIEKLRVALCKELQHYPVEFLQVCMHQLPW